jgi:ABC-2 type transport system ATP-binding protein
MQQVSKSFGSVGVRELTLDVPPGTILGLVGPSGCGKTTTVRLLTGVYRPDEGNIRVLGELPGHFRARTRARIGYMPQHYVLSKFMTVWDTLSFVASLYGMSWLGRSKRLREVLEFVELADVQRKQVGDLSGGMQRRLALACTLAHQPSMIFADEPTTGIDPVLRRKFWEHFHALRNQGCTLFVTTQYIGEVALCDRVAVMRDGRLLYMDTPDGLRRQALGGDALSLRVDPQQVRRAAALVDQQPYVREVRLSRRRPGTLYVTVDDAGRALPQLSQLLGDQLDVDLQNAEEYQPSFDDIFVRLMEQHDENGVESEVAHA